jgi:hypothetical protein
VNIVDLVDLITLSVERGQGPAPIPQPSDNPKLYPDVNGDNLMDIIDLVDLIGFLVEPPLSPAPIKLASEPDFAADLTETSGGEEEWLIALAADRRGRRQREPLW